jgi:5'-nucleotidase
MTSSLPSDTILNVNVPDLPVKELKGFKTTRLGQRHRSEPVIEARDPRNQKIYWVGPPGAHQDAGEGTDFHAVDNGYVSITPLQIDLTNHKRLAGLSAWIDGMSHE